MKKKLATLMEQLNAESGSKYSHIQIARIEREK